VRAQGFGQPFPDRLIDDFIAAYDGRDLDARKALVDAARSRRST
jgi:hypothetical protein